MHPPCTVRGPFVPALLSAAVLLASCDTSTSTPTLSTTNPPATEAPASGATSILTTADAVPPTFDASVAPIDDALRLRMHTSWRPGCPVNLEDLRYLRVQHWRFDGTVATGELVVHADAADDMVTVFGELFGDRFPIEQMVLVDTYGGDDDRSMAANNTSGFNCRTAGGTRWSEHAYGRAVDINPIQNPHVTGSSVEPDAGRRYTDRDDLRPGMIRADGAVVAAFGRVGWKWGGTWSSSKDYQHFSPSGR